MIYVEQHIFKQALHFNENKLILENEPFPPFCISVSLENFPLHLQLSFLTHIHQVI